MANTIPVATFDLFEDSKAVIENDSSNLIYLFRYNLVTEEGAYVSEWSTINQLNQNNINLLLDGFVPTASISSVESGGVGINVSWTVPESFIVKKLDIYFSWCYDSSISGTYTDFEYADTVTSNFYYIDIPTNGSSVKAKFVKVLVQVPTNIKTINTNARLFESPAKSTLPILDGGSIV
jgi:hypothetical protein